jgi:hypothetical protein
MPASQAKYTIMIPVKDNLGNDLGDIATAAHQWLWQATGNEGSYIEGPKRGNWRDDPQEEFNHLITVAADTPEMDSHIKQLAMEIARGANQWGVFCMKEGKSGIQSWVIDNPEYQEGQPAEIAGLAQQQAGMGGLTSAILSGDLEGYQRQQAQDYYNSFFRPQND